MPHPLRKPETPIAGAGEDLRALLDDIRARRREFAAQKHVSADIVARFKAIGVYRALVAHRFGGEERSPAEFLKLIETISTADASAGWVASFGIGAVYLAALPVATQEELYAAGPDVVFAGVTFPQRPALRVDGGYRVTGRWSWASGCTGADIVGVGIAPPPGEDTGGLPRMAVMPRAAATIIPNWDVSGLRGTGSHDLAVDDVFVEDRWTFVRGSAPTIDIPLYRYPTLSFATQMHAVVGLGAARATIDHVVATAKGRVSVTGAPNLGERISVQLDMARAEADLASARAWFYETIEEAWDAVLAGARPTSHQTSMMRLSATHAARVAADVARRVQLLTGMSGIYESNPIEAHVRDAQMIAQHAALGDITYQNAGAMLFGHQPLPGYL